MSEPIQSIAQNNYILSNDRPDTMYTSELEYDGDKISGYAGSAFAGDTYSAGDFIDITNDVISVDEVCNVSAGNGINIFQNNDYVTFELSLSAGITDVALVNELPAEPVATVLYLIPET